jgi:hypothetical protein
MERGNDGIRHRGLTFAFTANARFCDGQHSSAGQGGLLALSCGTSVTVLRMNMNENLPFVWRVTYRTGLEKITGYDLGAAHHKARQHLLNARTKKSLRQTIGTK